MRTIGGLFGRSAWGPLWEHLEKAKECVDLMKLSTEEFIKGNFDKLQVLAKTVTKIEKEADTIKENIRQRLTRSVFSSVERSEILAWLRQQDGVADSCEDLVKLFSLRKTNVPKELETSLTKLTSRVSEMACQLVDAVKIFGELDAADITRTQLNSLIQSIEDIQKAKDEIDTIQMEFLSMLFKVEQKMDPVSIFFLKDAAEKISRVADRIENVGDIMRHILTK